MIMWVIGMLEMISVKSATIEDVEPLYELNRTLIMRYEDIENIDLERVLAWVKGKLVDHINEYSVIYCDEKKVGYYCVTRNEDLWELDDFYVFEEYRGRGIGSYVLSELIKRYPRMFLYVFRGNTRAIGLYERFGFKVSKEVGNTRYIMMRE